MVTIMNTPAPAVVSSTYGHYAGVNVRTALLELQMESHTLPIISTAHLTQEVANVLSTEGNKNPWCICAAWEYGFFVHLDDLEAREVDGLKIPQCLIDVRDWLRSKNLPCISQGVTTRADWVRIDCDADPVADLPVYDW